MKRTMLGLAAALVLGIAGISVFGSNGNTASAAPAPPQCNGEMNQGGHEVACTVVVDNYIAAGGGLAITPLSTLTMTRCVGPSGPISTLTCTTTVTTLSEPVTTVQQCNGSGSGGGGTVICSVTIANHFEGSVPGIAPATTYQCVGSIITGTGGPGTCTPANTEGVSSVAEATVGQCNGSGNGGTSVGFLCSVSTNSTLSTGLPINVDQCNGSGNGGGALVICEATVTNDAFAPPATPTSPAATPTSPAATPTSPAATPTSPAATPTSPAATPTSPPFDETPFATPEAPNSTPQPQLPPVTPPTIPPTVPATPPNTTPQAQVPPSSTPSSTPQVPASSTPQAPATGDSSTSNNNPPGSPMLSVVGSIALVLGLAGFVMARRTASRQ